MRPQEEQVSASLFDWEELRRRRAWSGLLIGNGASRAVWDGFAYDSLYEKARELHGVGLDEEDEAVFSSLETRNFESVLAALRTAQAVNASLNLPTDELRRRYFSIRRALANAIREVHVPWLRVPDEALRLTRRALLEHEWVFSTNYDLLVYWAVLCEGARPRDIKDFFWAWCSEEENVPWLCFNPWDIGVGDDVTKVLYVHGALHLYEFPWSETAKRVAGGDENLLDVFYALAEPEEEDSPIPLLVAEGDARDKLRALGESPYLSFAYDRLVEHSGPLVVFGHGLGATDKHIADAVGRWRQRVLAISICPLGEDHVRAEKARYMQLFPDASIAFFDATTHPLGSPELRVLMEDA